MSALGRDRLGDGHVRDTSHSARMLLRIEGQKDVAAGAVPPQLARATTAMAITAADQRFNPIPPDG